MSAPDRIRTLPGWLRRGVSLAALLVIIGQLQRLLIINFPTHALAISVGLLMLFAATVFGFGLSDGRSDARANRDQTQRHDFALTWLLSSLVAGLLSGAVSWLISLAVKSLFVAGFVSQITTFAAFSALMVFLPATVAVALGRWLVDRDSRLILAGGAPTDPSADTDVLAAVHDDAASSAPASHAPDPVRTHPHLATVVDSRHGSGSSEQLASDAEA
jgi:hypothetical protein